MKFFIALLIFSITTLSFGKDLTNEEISNLYSSGKIVEKSLIEINLSATQTENLLRKINVSAVEITNEWPDTVLEGPYYLRGEAHLDNSSVLAIFSQNVLIGFSAYTSAPAVYNDECEFDFDISETEAIIKYEACLDDYQGVLTQKFLTNKNGELIEEYFEEVNFVQ